MCLLDLVIVGKFCMYVLLKKYETQMKEAVYIKDGLLITYLVSFFVFFFYSQGLFRELILNHFIQVSNAVP